MEKLHPNLVEEIVSRVPPESIMQAKFVCKTWRDILRHKKFGILFSFAKDAYRGKSSVELYYGDFDEIIFDNKNHDLYPNRTVKIDHPPIGKRDFDTTILASCNGLVCFSIPHHGVLDPIHICNPFTGEYVNLPRLIIRNRHYFIAGGFGYLKSTNEYKVLRVYYANPQIKEGFVQVYTLGDRRGWRDIGTTNYGLWKTGGTFANGAINFETTDNKIVGFSLRTEKFRVLGSPPCFRECDDDDMGKFSSLKVLGGDLCFIYINETPRLKEEEEPEFVEIWSFKKNKEKVWNWSKEFRMVCPDFIAKEFYEPLFITKKKELVLWHTDDKLCSYDPKTETMKILSQQDDDMLDHFEAILHMNTNISLKDMGVRSKKRRKN